MTLLVLRPDYRRVGRWDRMGGSPNGSGSEHMNRVCIFCGSSAGARPIFAEAAQAMGGALSQRGLSLVYGGGNIGLMGSIADAVLQGGGNVIGVIPKALVERELGHDGITELIVVSSMHERKAKMAELSDAFVAMPGGFGTFEEFCEIITWAQLGLHRKPCGILNVAGYYDPLLTLFDRAVAEGFLRAANRALVIQDSDPGRLLDMLANHTPPQTEKWIGRNES
jgi:uncharacterized protein (TIGR00730 family)